MSSTLAPFGFRPSFHDSGNMRAKAYTIASGYATSIFCGDAVKLVDAGVINLAAAGDTMLGIFMGCEYKDSLGKPTVSPFWPASTSATDIVAYVIDDPNIVFEAVYANPGTAGTDSVQTAVGELCDLKAHTTVGSTSTGLSTEYLDVISGGQFQIVGFSTYPGDSLTDAYVVAKVRMNEQHFHYPTAAI